MRKSLSSRRLYRCCSSVLHSVRTIWRVAAIVIVFRGSDGTRSSGRDGETREKTFCRKRCKFDNGEIFCPINFTRRHEIRRYFIGIFHVQTILQRHVTGNIIIIIITLFIPNWQILYRYAKNVQNRICNLDIEVLFFLSRILVF